MQAETLEAYHDARNLHVSLCDISGYYIFLIEALSRMVGLISHKSLEIQFLHMLSKKKSYQKFLLNV